jgi:hypothetical protein
MNTVTERAVATAGSRPFGLLALLVAEADAVTAAEIATPPLRSHYTAALGRVFRAEGLKRSARVRLTRIDDLGPDAFALEFTPVGRARLRDGAYVLRRRGVRAHELSLEAVADGAALRAVA